MSESNFSKLNSIDVSKHTEKKNGLTYLSWAWAWGELKKVCPNAKYTVYENKDGWNYHTDGKTCWVKTGVTIDDLEYIEYLPVMDFRNKSIPAEDVTSFDVNKSIQRSLTKAVARHGLGLCIYAGEDLPDTIDNRPIHTQKVGQKETPVADKLIIARVKKCKSATELNALWHKLQDEMGDNFADVKQVYTVVFAQRKAELNANN